MAFWLYSKDGDQYNREEAVRFTGKSGYLADFLHSHCEKDTPFAWELNAAALVGLVRPSADPSSYEIVIDMLPESLTEVSLYTITSLRGVSDFDETDLVMACQLLQQGGVTGPASFFKKSFLRDTPANGRQMVEAFHLTGGIATGTYYWSKPRMDIGAAICPAGARV